MSKYRVWAKTTRYYYIDIEAPSREDARDSVDQINSVFFHEVEDADPGWEIADIDPLEDDEEVDFTAEQIENGEAE